MMQVSFGYLAEKTTRITWNRGNSFIESLANYEEVVVKVSQTEFVFEGWFYPPLRPVKSGMNALLIPAGFSLPATHQIHLQASSATDEEANFMIALFGLLKGQRLQRPEWQHFYKAPVSRKLNDFLAKKNDIEKTMDIATEFWQQHTCPEIRRLAFGAMHWHLFAQLYEHEFERFNAQYMALDACAKLAKKIQFSGYPEERLSHAKQASKLCECTGVPQPKWVDKELAERRNKLVHEAMYIGKPIGFTHPVEHRNMELELTGLVARIFLSLLGVKNEYTQSECTARQPSGFGGWA